MPPRKTIPAQVRIQQINDIPNITFIKWDGDYINSVSRAIVRCDSGHEWSSRVNNLVSGGKGCAQCYGNRKFTEEERVNQINNRCGIRFIAWIDGYKNAHSKAICGCVCGNEWVASINDLVNNGTGCQKCSRESAGVKLRKPESEQISKINDIDNVTFVSWESGRYKNKDSKAVCRCDFGHEWTARIRDLIRGDKRTGCPTCSVSGYDKEKPATLYALLSKCGSYIKIGISNDYKTRHATLKRKTPFEWHCLHSINTSGGEAQRLEAMLHSKYERAEFGFKFDGYTEWLVCTPELLEEIRSIANGNS